MSTFHEHHSIGSSREANSKRLLVALILVSTYMIAEFVGGLVTNSLALLADAGHMLTDAASLGLSLFALWVARRPASPQKTFGYYRIEILAALVNGASLVAIAILILIEAYRRFSAPPEIKGGLMLAIAIGGLVINLLCLLVLRGGRGDSLNVRGAFLHVLSDTLGSVQAIAAGVLIMTLGWRWTDPVASALIGLLVMASSWSLLKETTSVLMEGAPGHIDVDEVHRAILSVKGAVGLHDLHIWTITSGFVALSAHVVVDSEYRDDVLWQTRELLRDKFGIQHSTIQIEVDNPQRIKLQSRR